MPAAGAREDSPLSFTRRALSATSRRRRAELADVHPHRWYRRLRTELTRLREEEPSYEVVAERDRDLAAEATAVGHHTTAFTGRAQARAQARALGGARLTYRPWGPHGAGAIVLALGLGLFGPLSNLVLVAALFLGLLGAGLFAVTRQAEVPLRRRDVVSVLVQGEARERWQQVPEGRCSLLRSDVGVVYAAEVFLSVDEERVDELGWPLRVELSNRCEAWAAPEDVDEHAGPLTGFVDALRAWTQLDADWTRYEVDQLQRELGANLARRQAYTRVLERLRAGDVRDRELARVERELAALDERMRAHADREDRSVTRSTRDPEASLEVRRPRRPVPRSPPPRRNPRRRPSPPSTNGGPGGGSSNPGSGDAVTRS